MSGRYARHTQRWTKQRFFAPPQCDGLYDDKYKVEEATTGGGVVVVPFDIPHDFAKIVEAKLLVICSGVLNLDYDLQGAFAKEWEAYNQNVNVRIAGLTANIMGNVIHPIDVKCVLGGLAACHVGGLSFTNNDGTVAVYVIGLRIRYT